MVIADANMIKADTNMFVSVHLYQEYICTVTPRSDKPQVPDFIIMQVIHSEEPTSDRVNFNEKKRKMTIHTHNKQRKMTMHTICPWRDCI